jgi:hypothetical protein
MLPLTLMLFDKVLNMSTTPLKAKSHKFPKQQYQYFHDYACFTLQLFHALNIISSYILNKDPYNTFARVNVNRV